LANKLFLILILSASLLPQLCIQAQDNQLPEIASIKQEADGKAVDSLLNQAPGEQTSEKQPIEKEFQSTQGAPDWLKRINMSLEAGTDIKPKYFLESVQPLFSALDKETVLFNQTRISARDYRTTYSTGLGLRKVFNENYLLGINAFYDFQDFHKHHRAGVGFEAITNRGLEARLNSYLRVSGQRLVNEDSANQYYEKVANGCDWELGGPLPYFHPVKLYGGGYWYNFERFKDEFGWKMRMEYNPVKYSRLVFEVRDDNKRENVGYRFEGAITLAFASFNLRDIVKEFKTPSEAYPKVNLEDKTLDRVVRDFDITVIKSTRSKATGLTVEGGKSG